MPASGDFAAVPKLRVIVGQHGPKRPMARRKAEAQGARSRSRNVRMNFSPDHAASSSPPDRNAEPATRQSVSCEPAGNSLRSKPRMSMISTRPPATRLSAAKVPARRCENQEGCGCSARRPAPQHGEQSRLTLRFINHHLPAPLHASWDFPSGAPPPDPPIEVLRVFGWHQLPGQRGLAHWRGPSKPPRDCVPRPFSPAQYNAGGQPYLKYCNRIAKFQVSIRVAQTFLSAGSGTSSPQFQQNRNTGWKPVNPQAGKPALPAN